MRQVIEFLHRIGDVLKDYLNEVREDVVKENFLLLYQLLDEMMDNGMPLTTEPNILKSMILPPTTLGRMVRQNPRSRAAAADQFVTAGRFSHWSGGSHSGSGDLRHDHVECTMAKVRGQIQQ